MQQNDCGTATPTGWRCSTAGRMLCIRGKRKKTARKYIFSAVLFCVFIVPVDGPGLLCSCLIFLTLQKNSQWLPLWYPLPHVSRGKVLALSHSIIAGMGAGAMLLPRGEPGGRGAPPGRQCLHPIRKEDNCSINYFLA